MKKKFCFFILFFSVFFFLLEFGCGDKKKTVKSEDVPVLILEAQVTNDYLIKLDDRGKALVHFILTGSGSLTIDYWVEEIQGDPFYCSEANCYFEMKTGTVFSVTPSGNIKEYNGEMNCVTLSNSCKITAQDVFTLTVNFG